MTANMVPQLENKATALGAEKDAVKGLGCPRCGGMVPVPEGQAVVICPYCDQRSILSGLRGVRRYQAPLKVGRDEALDKLKGFLNGKFQVARDCARLSKVSEIFLVHLPFWAVWARGLAVAFGQVKVGSGNNERWEPREKKLSRDLNWNLPACEVGEFGVRQVSLEGCVLEPFDAAALHRSGMVFEPVGSSEAALETARAHFDETIRGEVQMARTAQVFTRLVRPRLGLVYYPLWVVRYHYHGRSFQVVVDGYSGQLLYGKAPGSVGYRAGVLVGGMAAGAVIAVDLPALILASASSSDDNPFLFALFIFVVGLGVMYGAYRTFRYGEHYEYHRFRVPGKNKGALGGAAAMLNLPGDLKQIREIVAQVEQAQGGRR
jgi:hypothetical protein